MFRIAAIAVVALSLAPGVASSRIYQWIDEDGSTVYSNVLPADTRALKGFKVALEDEPAPAPAVAAEQAVQAAREDALRTTQALQRRIDELEQRLQAMQSQPQPAPPPAANVEYAPAGFAVPYAVPFSFLPAPALFVVRPRLAGSRPIVNSGPVFATPAGSRFAPGVFSSSIGHARPGTFVHGGARAGR